jgi:hypothetical protein
MSTAFNIVWNLIFGLIAIVYPFVAAFCERHLLKTFLIAWGLLISYTIFLCALLPLLVGHFNKALEIKMYDAGFDGPFIFAVVVLGWLYPLIAELLGYASKWLWIKFRDRH